MITIIIPIRNEEPYIAKCLDSIFYQDYPLNQIEIIIADGMSTDKTRDIIREYQEKYPNIQLIDNPGKIVSTGMNNALRLAKGDPVIRIDGHCIISPDYIKNCLQHLQNGEVDGVGGPMETIGETPLSETIAMAMSSSFGVGNSAFRTMSGKTMFVDTIPFPAYPKSIIAKVGFYDEELIRNQDDEYNYRIREHGGKLLLSEDVKSQYFSRGNLGKLWGQFFQYGFFKVRVFQKHPRQMSLRQFIPPLFVTSIILSIILGFFSLWGKLMLLSITASYIVVNLFSSYITAGKKGLDHFPLLPAIFAIIHISYGYGFLLGFFRFWNRWTDKIGKVPKI